MNSLEREDMKRLIAAASKIPCELCRIKGGSNIEENGSCRHSGSLTFHEAVNRLEYAANEVARSWKMVSDATPTPPIKT